MRLLIDDRMCSDCEGIGRTWEAGQALLQAKGWKALHLGVVPVTDDRKDGLALVEWALARNRLPVRVMLLSESIDERDRIGLVLRRNGWASADGRRFLKQPIADEIAAPFFPRIRIFGVGDSDRPVLQRRITARIGDARFVAVPSEQQAFETGAADPPCPEQEGRQVGSEKGMSAAHPARVEALLKATDLVFIVPDQMDAASLERAAWIAGLARDQGVLSLAIVDHRPGMTDVVTSPLAASALERLVSRCDAVLTIPDYIAVVCRKRIGAPSSLEMVTYLLTSLVEAITFPDLVNIDFNAFRYAFRGAGSVVIGMGAAAGADRAAEASRAAMHSLALNAPNLDRVDRLVILIDAPWGGMAMDEVLDVVSNIQAHASREAFITYGTVQTHGDDGLHIMILATEFTLSHPT